MESRAYHVSGRVQGVGFRWWTQKVATELGLIGDVRNLPDGTVEVRAAGPLAALEALEEALGEGPPSARVESVAARTLDGQAARWSAFSIARD